MKKYETLLLFSPDLTSEERQAILDKLTNVIQAGGGQVSAVDEWGMRELAYPVKKFTRGYYIRIEYGSTGTEIYELERVIRISEGILKFITVKLQETFEITQEA